MIKYTGKSYLQEEGFLLVYSSRKMQSVMVGRTWQQAEKACCQKHLHSGNLKWTKSGSLFNALRTTYSVSHCLPNTVAGTILELSLWKTFYIHNTSPLNKLLLCWSVWNLTIMVWKICFYLMGFIFSLAFLFSEGKRTHFTGENTDLWLNDVSKITAGH